MVLHLAPRQRSEDTSGHYRRHKVVQLFRAWGTTFNARRSPMTNHNDKHGTTCARRVAAHELFARKLVYRVIMPKFVLYILRGKSVERKSIRETVADRVVHVSRFFLAYYVTLKSSIVNERTNKNKLNKRNILIFDRNWISVLTNNNAHNTNL